MPVDKLTIEQFAQRVKAKYPQYKDIDDSVLVDKITAKHPVYKDKIRYDQPSTAQPAAPKADFKPMTDWLSIPDGGYKPMMKEAVVPIDSHTTKTAQAQDRVSGHLGDIDKSVSNLIYDYKKDLAGRAKSVQLGMNPKEAAPVNHQAIELDAKLSHDISVTDDEVGQFKEEMKANDGMQRAVIDRKIKDLSMVNPGAANQLKADMYRLDRQDNPDREKKIDENVKRINKGEIEYDPKRGLLYNPHGFFGSLAIGYKQKGQLFKDYEFFTKTDNEAAIISELNHRMKDQDPDDPIDLPVGSLGEAGAMLGGQPIKPLVGGAIAGWLGTPTAGAAAAAGISAHEMYKLGYAGSLQKNYTELKKSNPEMPDYTAYSQAKSLAEKQAAIDAATGAAMGFVGGKSALGPSGIATPLLRKSVGAALNQVGEAGAKKIIEGLGVGAVGAGGQVVKNLMAQKAGVETSTDEGVAEQLIAGVTMTAGMALIAKAPKLLKASTYRDLLHSAAKLPEHVADQEFNNLMETGVITTEELQAAQKAMREQRSLDQSIPEDVPDVDRLKIQDKIKKRDALKEKTEKVHEAFHPEIKEDIKKIDEDIVGISKGSDRGELQKLVDKEHKAGKVDEFVTDVLRNATEKELESHFKDIAEQANVPETEQAAIDTFGEAIVKKAKELYPDAKPEPVTIKESEDATRIRSDEGQVQVGGDEPQISKNESGEVLQRNASEEPRAPGSEQQAGESVQTPLVAEENVGVNPEHDAPDTVGITHARMDEVAEQLGFDTYAKDPESLKLWDKQARERFAKDPMAIDKVIQKLRNGEGVDKVETRMMIMHFADVMAKYEKNPTPDGLNYIKRITDLYNISGREKGKELVARKGSMPKEEMLAQYHMTDVDFNKGAPLTEKQMAQSTKEYNGIKAVNDALKEKVMKMEADAIKAKAEKVIETESKSIKKDSKKNYKEERSQILKDIADKWKKSSKDSLGASIVPFAKEFAAIAPDVMKLVRNMLEEGIDKLPDIIAGVHRTIKDIIPGLEEKDVHDIIAGVYDKRSTRSQLAEQLYNLRKEAQLLNQLEQLQRGEIPDNERAQRKRNQKLEELRRQIKELKDEMGLNEKTDEQKLASLKGRYKAEIKELEKKLANGDYKPDEKPAQIALDSEGQALRDKLLELKEQRAIRLLEQEYGNRNKIEKISGVVSKVIKTGRTLQSSFDVSYPFRQTLPGLTRELLSLPFSYKNGKWEYNNFANQKQLATQFKKMYHSFASEKEFRRVMDDIHKDPRYDMAQKAGLDFADPISNLDRAKEEMFQKSYAEDIPLAKTGVKASHRAATIIANKMKWDIFTELTDRFAQDGKTYENSKNLYEATARYANQLVGRGILGEKLEMAAPVIAHFVYSLRLYASRLQLLTYLVNPRFYTKIPKEIRMEYLKDMTRLLAVGGSVMGLAAATGLRVGLNPYDSDFGSIIAGNTRYDVWGGFKQYAVLMSRLLGGKANSDKELKPLFSDEPTARNQKTHGDVITRFLRSKASPELGTIINIVSGSDFAGKPVTVGGAAKDYFVPLIYKDVSQTMQDGGVQQALITLLLAAHGVGVNTYTEDIGKKRKTRKQVQHKTKTRKIKTK